MENKHVSGEAFCGDPNMFHMMTDVGKYLISTVQLFHLPANCDAYETMVRTPNARWVGQKTYKTEAEAAAGHEATVQKWNRKLGLGGAAP
jgi:hypothetical protein